MFGSVWFRFGKQNFNWLVLFGLGRTVKHCFGRSLMQWGVHISWGRMHFLNYAQVPIWMICNFWLYSLFLDSSDQIAFFWNKIKDYIPHDNIIQLESLHIMKWFNCWVYHRNISINSHQTLLSSSENNYFLAFPKFMHSFILWAIPL